MEEERRPEGEQRSIKRVSARRGGMGRGALRTIVGVVVVIGAVAGALVYVFYLAPPSDRVEIVIDGSSTVFPITSSWAEVLNDRDPNVRYVVSFSGSGAGFEKFCDGRTHLSDASRPIRAEELAICEANGIDPLQFQVAFDGISIVVHGTNTFAQSLTVQELCRIWTSSSATDACGGAGGQVNRWSALDASWPEEEINLWGPGTDSGTFDYFVEVILDAYGETIRGEQGWNPSEDDNILVGGVSSDPYALGYLGFAYYVENTDILNAVAVDNGSGPVAPTPTTIENGDYAPLSRPIFVYADANGSLNRRAVKDFLQYGLSTEGQDIVTQVGYVRLNEDLRQEQLLMIPS